MSRRLEEWTLLATSLEDKLESRPDSVWSPGTWEPQRRGRDGGGGEEEWGWGVQGNREHVEGACLYSGLWGVETSPGVTLFSQTWRLGSVCLHCPPSSCRDTVPAPTNDEKKKNNIFIL